MGEAGSGRAGRPGGRVAEVWGSVWSAENVPSQIPSEPEKGDSGERVG